MQSTGNRTVSLKDEITALQLKVAKLEDAMNALIDWKEQSERSKVYSGTYANYGLSTPKIKQGLVNVEEMMAQARTEIKYN
jgi:hypothetical protein